MIFLIQTLLVIFEPYRQNEDEMGILKSPLMFEKMFKKVVTKHMLSVGEKLFDLSKNPMKQHALAQRYVLLEIYLQKIY